MRLWKSARPARRGYRASGRCRTCLLLGLKVLRAQFCKARLRARKCAHQPPLSMAATAACHGTSDYAFDRVVKKFLCGHGANKTGFRLAQHALTVDSHA